MHTSSPSSSLSNSSESVPSAIPRLWSWFSKPTKRSSSAANHCVSVCKSRGPIFHKITEDMRSKREHDTVSSPSNFVWNKLLEKMRRTQHLVSVQPRCKAPHFTTYAATVPSETKSKPSSQGLLERGTHLWSISSKPVSFNRGTACIYFWCINPALVAAVDQLSRSNSFQTEDISVQAV